jgi:hypothetical protein
MIPGAQLWHSIHTAKLRPWRIFVLLYAAMLALYLFMGGLRLFSRKEENHHENVNASEVA